MKKITIIFLFVCLFSMGLVAEKDSLSFGVKAESWDIPITYEPASLLKYRHVMSQKSNECIYDYEMLMNKVSGNQAWQSLAFELNRTFFNKRAELFGGIGFAEIGLNLNQPEYVVNSNFITQFDESPDSQTCLGDSVHAKGKYQPFWYTGAKINILKTKSWKMGVEGRYLSFSNSDFAFPLQYKTNWGKADMEFSIKGTSLKLQMAEAKAFGSFNISKKLEVSVAGGYLYEKKEISGKSRYFYKQNLVNIDYNQDWKLMAKPETNWFAEGSVSALLTRNLKATISGNFGAKQGFAVGISYSFGKTQDKSFGKKETAAAIVKPAAKPVPTPTKPAPVKFAPFKKAANKPVTKPTVKPMTKKIAVASKEEAKKPAVVKPTKLTPPCISSTHTYLFRLGMRLLGFPFLEFGFQFGTIPNASKTSKK